MKLASFHHGGRAGFGVVKGDGIVDLTAAFFFETRYADLREVFAAGAVDELRRAAEGAEADLGLTDVSFLLPIPRPSKIFCVGSNYHVSPKRGGGSATPEWPSIFGRFADSFAAHGEPIIRPKESEQLDYEGELAIVIGRQGRHIPESKALDHVGGYTCLDDGSLRDWQVRGAQNGAGKNFRHSGAIGPWIATADEIPDPGKLEITTRVNGETRQHGTTDQMIFDVPYLISYISKFTQLEPGDIIATGSCDTAAVDMDAPAWLKPGDKLEVEIAGIGVLQNPVAAE
jgi:5-carboxymethyl-2-hydroxymuconate isomerase